MNDPKAGLERRLDTLREPFAAFIGAQTTASAMLLVALAAAMVIANGPLAARYIDMQHFELGLVLGPQQVAWSVQHLMNDGLIAVFFFLIGLEVKRELLAGELREGRRRTLLLSAATGGMLVPSLLYLAINGLAAGGATGGWAIPMATDTALAIGVLAALDNRVPRSVVAFVVGVAIIDDIGAILVIALVYTQSLAGPAIAAAAGLVLILFIFNRAGLRHPLPYALAALALWVAIVKSGLHASIAGVIVATLVPARPRIPPERMAQGVRRAVDNVNPHIHHRAVLGDGEVHRKIADVEQIAQAATTPLRRWENSLELPVALVVLPLFVFLNAGVAINADTLRGVASDPVALGILAGLVVGKPVGLYLGVRLGERLGIARRPADLRNDHLLGIGLLAGIGFTMSTFVAHLALGSDSAATGSAKLAIVVSSLLAAVGGYAALRRTAR